MSADNQTDPANGTTGAAETGGDRDRTLDWYRFNDPYVSMALCIAYGLVFCFGLIGNLLVVHTKRMLHCVTDLFLLNLALADLLVILACLPFNLVSSLIRRKFHFQIRILVFFRKS